MLAAALPAPKLAAPLAVLLIEPGIWTRLTPRAAAWAVTEHADGPKENDIALIVSEPALRDLIDGRLSGDAALERGVVMVSGDRLYREPLIAALRQAYPGKGSPMALR